MVHEFRRMSQIEDESLDDLIERFMYNLKREKIYHLSFDTLKSSYLEQLGMSGLISLIL